MESKLSLLALLSSLHFVYIENKERLPQIRMDAQEIREHYRFIYISPEFSFILIKSLGNGGMYQSPTQQPQ